MCNEPRDMIWYLTEISMPQVDGQWFLYWAPIGKAPIGKLKAKTEVEIREKIGADLFIDLQLGIIAILLC